MSLSLVPAGATVAKVYYSIPGHYGLQETFELWDEAVEAAQRKLNTRIQALRDSLGGYATEASVRATATTQVVLELRWVIEYDGGSLDTAVERYTEVSKLRVSTTACDGTPAGRGNCPIQYAHDAHRVPVRR